MSNYFLKWDQVSKLFTDGLLKTRVSRAAFLLPSSLIVIGLYCGFFLGLEYTDNQIIFGFGGLFLMTIWLPLAFHRPVLAAKD